MYCDNKAYLDETDAGHLALLVVFIIKNTYMLGIVKGKAHDIKKSVLQLIRLLIG